MSLSRRTAARRTARQGAAVVAAVLGVAMLAGAVSRPQGSTRTEALTYGVSVREIFILKVDVR